MKGARAEQLRGIKILSHIKGAQAAQLHHRQNDKARIVVEVAPPQTGGFLRKAKEPLQAAALHPERSLAFVPSVKVKRNANPQHDRLYFSPMRCHPAFLFGTTQTDK